MEEGVQTWGLFPIRNKNSTILYYSSKDFEKNFEKPKIFTTKCEKNHFSDRGSRYENMSDTKTVFISGVLDPFSFEESGKIHYHMCYVTWFWLGSSCENCLEQKTWVWLMSITWITLVGRVGWFNFKKLEKNPLFTHAINFYILCHRAQTTPFRKKLVKPILKPVLAGADCCVGCIENPQRENVCTFWVSITFVPDDFSKIFSV